MAKSLLVKKLKAARELAGWTQQELATHSGVPHNTLTKIESEISENPKEVTLSKLETALNRVSVFYLEKGVEMRDDAIRFFRGADWAVYLLEDILIKARNGLFRELYLSGVDEKQSSSEIINLLRQIRKEKIKIYYLIEEDNSHRLGLNHEYRYVPKDQFINWPSFVYGDYVAICTDYENECQVLNNVQLARVRRREFRVLWDTYKEPMDESTADERY
ncbi:MAG: helix-turn-helix transcriptional regulator [Cyclobacteriaceae bacterium]